MLTVPGEAHSHVVVVMVNRGDGEGCDVGEVRLGELMKAHLAEQLPLRKQEINKVIGKIIKNRRRIYTTAKQDQI